MDLYTASQRLARWHVADGSPLGVGDYALVGDGFAAALVGIDGSVDWLCFPRFDSPSVFGALVDPERGGRFRIAPAADRYECLQGYDTDTNVLQTLFRRDGEGTVSVSDLMPWIDGPHSSVHEMHRLVEAREGSLEMEVIFDPRFDYARRATRVSVAGAGALAEGEHGERLSVSVGPDPVRFEPRPGGGVSARFRVRPGKRTWVILSWRSKRPEPVAAHRPFEHLRRTRRFWRSWSARLRYDGPWRHDVLRSALTLKLLQYAPTGGMVAAPTTSLPVAPDGSRNWDYRFSWMRDSALAIRAMNLIGYRDEALGFFHFVRESVGRRGRLDLMLTLDGSDVPPEEELHHLSGHAGSGHVRVGNAAAGQIQHDVVGPLVDAAFLYERSGGITSLRLWREIRALVDGAVATIDDPDHGIWEPRAELRHNVHSKLMAWVALDRALALAPLFGGDREEPRWQEARASLAREIVEKGYDAERGTFVGEYGGREVDATLLLLPAHGFLPPTDTRVLRTIDRVREDLGEGRFLRRYRGGDGIGSGEGAFVLCGFWLAEALALAGRLDEALDAFQHHLGAANHVGLLAEEVDPDTGAALGNFPQAFSHLGLIQAAARLDLALRLRDEGDEHPPRHAVDHPARRR